MAGRFVDGLRLGLFRALKKKTKVPCLRRAEKAKVVGSTCDLDTVGDFLEAMGMTRDEIEEVVLGFLEAPSTFDPEGVVKKRLGS